MDKHYKIIYQNKSNYHIKVIGLYMTFILLTFSSNKQEII